MASIGAHDNLAILRYINIDSPYTGSKWIQLTNFERLESEKFSLRLCEKIFVFEHLSLRCSYNACSLSMKFYS